MSKPTTVLLMDDHPLFRKGLKAMLESSYPAFVVKEAGSLEAARRLIGAGAPDIAILDVTLPDGDGISFAGEILSIAPDCRVHILTMHRRSGLLLQARSAGCRGYFLKEGDGSALLDALGDERAGFRMSSGLEELCQVEQPSSGLTAFYAVLTRREKEIFRLYAEGLGYKEVAWKLGISPRTASVHRYNIFKKLKITSEVELVRAAREVGLID